MNKKIILIAVAVVALFIGAFVLITVTTPSTTATNVEESTKAKSDDIEESSSDESASTVGDKAAADELIDQTVSGDEIEKTVGKWGKFDMSSQGCERGVYSGKFFYKDFTIISRTYDKGQTFHVIAVNE